MGFSGFDEVARARIAMITFGALAALMLWGLGELWSASMLGARVFVALFSFATVLFGGALMLSGPVPLRRALAGGLILALPVCVLVLWASFRHDDAADYMRDGVGLGVALAAAALSAPFMAAWLRKPAHWRDYPLLFDIAWGMVARVAAALSFVAIFWGVALASDSLLELVDISAIGLLFETEWLSFSLSGAVLGLGLAVSFELRRNVSTHLILRLLRLLVPPVLVVVAVFLVALVVRGLSDVFGDFSSAATLMAVAALAVGLVSTAIDRSDTSAVSTPGLRLAVQALALATPVLAGLGLWSVAIRVAQYGWTPSRVEAATLGGALVVYGVLYAVSVLRRGAWMTYIRRANVWAALAMIGLAALWQTPLLDTGRISAESQAARYLDGRANARQVPLWELRHEWGRAGRAVLGRLAAAAQDPLLAERLAALDGAQTRYQFEDTDTGRRAEQTARDLDGWVPVRPEGSALPPGGLAGVPPYRLEQWQAGCRQILPGGQPGCVLVLGEFLPGRMAGRQGMMVFLAPDGATASIHHLSIAPDGRAEVREVFDIASGMWPELPPDAIAEILAGRYGVHPSGMQALELGGRALIPDN